jgi:hypothetical protein
MKMDDRISFDVYAKVANPSCRVEFDAFDSWVSVTIGNPSIGSPINMLQLWFKEADLITELGNELVSAGTKLSAHRAAHPSTLDEVVERDKYEENVSNGL